MSAGNGELLTGLDAGSLTGGPGDDTLELLADPDGEVVQSLSCDAGTDVITGGAPGTAAAFVPPDCERVGGELSVDSQPAIEGGDAVFTVSCPIPGTFRLQIALRRADGSGPIGASALARCEGALRVAVPVGDSAGGLRVVVELVSPEVDELPAYTVVLRAGST